MRKLIVTAEEFNDFLYPAAATAKPTDMAEMRKISKILDKLEEKAQPKEQKDRMGSTVIVYQLRDDVAEFLFQDAEGDFLASQLEEIMKQEQAWKGRRVVPMIVNLRKDIEDAETSEAGDG